MLATLFMSWMSAFETALNRFVLLFKLMNFVKHNKKSCFFSAKSLNIYWPINNFSKLCPKIADSKSHAVCHVFFSFNQKKMKIMIIWRSQWKEKPQSYFKRHPSKSLFFHHFLFLWFPQVCVVRAFLCSFRYVMGCFWRSRFQLLLRIASALLME